MNLEIEEVLTFLDAKLQPDRLCDLQELVLRGVWARQSYDAIAESSGYTSEYIKHVGAQLWQLLSQAFSEKVTKGNVRSVLRRHWQSSTNSEPDSTPPPKIYPHCRTSAELATVEQWILQDCCRMMTLLGIGERDRNPLSLLMEKSISGDGVPLSTSTLYTIPKVQQILTESIEFLSEFVEVLHRVLAVALSPDAKLLATGNRENEICIWHIANSKPLLALQGHTQSVCTLAFSPDGRVLASGSEDCTVRLWDAEQGQCRQALQGHTQSVRAVAFSPDSRKLASGSEDRTVRLWDIQEGQCLHILQGHTQSIRALTFSSDSRTLASGSEDGTVRLWDVRGGQCRQVLRSPNCQICSILFDADGQTGAMGCQENTIQLWHPLGSHVEKASRVGETTLDGLEV